MRSILAPTGNLCHFSYKDIVHQIVFDFLLRNSASIVSKMCDFFAREASFLFGQELDKMTKGKAVLHVFDL